MAGAMSGIKPPPQLNLKENVLENWRILKLCWEKYSILANVEQKEANFQKALFLHCIGPEATKIFNTPNLAYVQRTVPKQPEQPTHSHEVPDGPWLKSRDIYIYP